MRVHSFTLGAAGNPFLGKDPCKQLAVGACTGELLVGNSRLIITKPGVYNFDVERPSLELHFRGAAGATLYCEVRTEQDTLLQDVTAAGLSYLIGSAPSLSVTQGPLRLVTALIAAGTSITNERDLGVDGVPYFLEMSAAWTAADMTFQAAAATGGAFGDVWVNGAEVVLPVNGMAGRIIALDDRIRQLSARFLKLRSGTAAAPVNQVADALLRLWIR